MLGITSFRATNVFTLITLYDLCFFSVKLGDKLIHVHVWNFGSHMQMADRWAIWKAVSRAESLVLQALQFRKVGECRKFPGGTGVSHYGLNECFMVAQFNVRP